MNTDQFNEYVEQATDLDVDDVARLIAENIKLKVALKNIQYEAAPIGLMPDTQYRVHTRRKLTASQELCQAALKEESSR